MTSRFLLLLGALIVVISSPRAWQGAAQPAERKQTVEVFAERFSFTPSEIKTTLGTTLTITLTSDDTSHGFHIIGTNVDVEIPKRGRGTTTVNFKPETAGRYTFECSQLCGAGHSFMRGTLIVTAPAEEKP